MTMTISFEGNLYGAINLQGYEQRVEHAAARMITRYPTIAKALVPADDLVAVGTFSPRDGLRLNPDHSARVAELLEQWTQ